MHFAIVKYLLMCFISNCIERREKIDFKFITLGPKVVRFSIILLIFNHNKGINLQLNLRDYTNI